MHYGNAAIYAIGASRSMQSDHYCLYWNDINGLRIGWSAKPTKAERCNDTNYPARFSSPAVDANPKIGCKLYRTSLIPIHTTDTDTNGLVLCVVEQN